MNAVRVMRHKQLHNGQKRSTEKGRGKRGDENKREIVDGGSWTPVEI
jgi:hypothetical protein